MAKTVIFQPSAKPGAVLRDELAIRMTSDQLLAAKKLVREWKPPPYERPTH